MKKITLALLAFTSVIVLFAQTPQSFKYQAVARNSTGDILSEQDVSFRISILESSAVGTTVYVETHLALTSQLGLVNLEIGDGVEVTGNFASIDWGSNSFFLQIEMDETGGTNYQLMGTSQLLSVPYALFSENTANPDDNDWIISGDDIYSTIIGNVGIGTTSPASLLHINGSGNENFLRITGPSSTGGLKLGCNSAGVSYLANSENTHLYISTNSASRIAIQNTGNVGIGTVSPSALLDVAGHISISSTGSSVFVGYGAGINDDLSSNYNNFVGYLAGNSNTSGDYNCGFGTWALNDNTNGYGNNAFGDYALINNTTGDENCAFGYISMHNNETGSGNTVMGNSALRYNVGGSNNTALGFYAGHNTSQSGSVYIGYKAGYYSNSSNKLYIENSDSNFPLVYGDFSTDILAINGKLGIGTNTPGVKLHVVGGTGSNLASGGFLVSGAISGANIVIDDNEIMARVNGAISTLYMQRFGGIFRVHSNLSETYQFNVGTDGKTGIGENAPNSKLHINANSGENGLRVEIASVTKLLLASNGSVALYNASAAAFALELQNSSADLYGRARAYSWNVYSDDRLKSNQRSIEYGLKEVMQLQPKSYDHHSSSTSENGDFVMVTDEKVPAIGFIAQEMQQVIPEAVSEPQDDSKNLWSMDYNKLIPVLTRAIQEQQAIIEKLNTENKEFRVRIEVLESN